MTFDDAINHLDQAVTQPENGLPEELFLYISRVTPLINVDLLIQDEQKRTLLTWRDDEFFGGGWHIPGGIIRYKEQAVDRIRKCAEEELGSAVDFDAAPSLIIENIDEKRRNRAHFISMLYRCRLLSEPDPVRRAQDPPQRGEWRWHGGCPDNLLPVQKVYAHLL